MYRLKVTDVSTDGAAFSAGIKVGDYLESYDGIDLATAEKLQKAVSRNSGGDHKIKVIRANELLELPCRGGRLGVVVGTENIDTTLYESILSGEAVAKDDAAPLTKKSQRPQSISQKINKKSPLIAFILAFLFGPLGLFYISIIGAVVMTALSLVSIVLLSSTLAYILWIISMVWNVYGAFANNADVKQQIAENKEQQAQQEKQEEADDEWATLVKYDETVKAAVEKVQNYGDAAVAELRKAYSVVKDKEQLPRIADQIVSEYS